MSTSPSPAPAAEPTVLMVVPTLGRRPDMLAACLESIGSQGVVGIDLVVVAPAAAGLADLVAAHGARLVDDPRRGISGALNAGLDAAATGTRYFAWLGDDDLLAPGSLAATTDALEHTPDATMAYGWCDYIDESGATVFASRAGALAARIVTFGPNLIPQPGCLMRLADVVAAGGLDEGLTLAMDLDLFLRLRRRGRLLALPRTLASFRWHEDSATVSDEDASAEQSDRVRQRYMRPSVARGYEYLRWPGRWALRLAKLRVRHNLRRASGARGNRAA